MRQKFPDETFVGPKLGTGLRLVVAEAPGQEESIVGEPLVGGSGRRFDALCRAAGVKRDELTLTNTINCRPPGNVYPTDAAARRYITASEAEAAVAHCFRAHLTPLLESRPWQRLDLLGDKALRVLANKTGILNWRGYVVPIPSLGNRLIGMPTCHPSYVARDQVMSKVVVSDLAKGLICAPERYNLYPSLDDVRAFDSKTVSFDIENDPDTLKISVVGLCGEAHTALCVPFQGAYIPEIRRILANATAVIGQNSLQHDEPILKDNGCPINPDAEHWDVMLMQHLLMPDLEHNLNFIGSIFVQKERWKHLHGENEEVYNCRDADATYQIWLQLLPMLRKEGLLALYKNVQVPLARICHVMSETGIKVDPNRLAQVRTRLLAELAQLEAELPVRLQTQFETVNKRSLAPPGTLSAKTGKPVKYVSHPIQVPVIPWRSPDFLKKYLYVTLGLPPQLHAQTKEITVDKGALDKLYRKTKLPELATLRKLKKVSTLLSSFATEGLAAQGFQHTHFNVHGTASGRLSSSDPNLQNQPESARFLYVPRHPGWEFLEVDYSGIENQLTALFADDTERLQHFLSDPNYSEHKHAVEIFFGIPYADVDKDNDKDAPYGKAKRIVHGCNYGLGARKLAMMYDMDERECKDLIAKWKNAIPKTTEWQNATAKLAEQTGVLRTVFGRQRWFWTDSVYTESLSFLPQSSAADVIFKVMVSLYHDRIGLALDAARRVIPIVRALPRPALMVLQVHDSLLFELPREMRDEVACVVKDVMTQSIPELGGFSIPIGMKVGSGSWGELEPYEV